MWAEACKRYVSEAGRLQPQQEADELAAELKGLQNALERLAGY